MKTAFIDIRNRKIQRWGIKHVVGVLFILGLSVLWLPPSTRVVDATGCPCWAGSHNMSKVNNGGMVDITYGNPYVRSGIGASSEWIMMNQGPASGQWAQSGWYEHASWEGPRKWIQFAGQGIPGGYVNHWDIPYIQAGTQQHAEVWTVHDANNVPTVIKGQVCDSGAGNCFTKERPWQEVGFAAASFFQVSGESHIDLSDDIGGLGEQNAVELKFIYYFQNPNRSSPANPNLTYQVIGDRYRVGFIWGLSSLNNFKNWTAL